MTIRLKKEKISNKECKHKKAQDFIAAGVACYAFSLIDELGLVEKLLSEEGLFPAFFRSYPNPLVVRTAIQTLECNDIVFFDKNVFRFTAFGESLVLHRGSIGLIYSGYRRLLSNQLRIAQDQPSKNWDLIDERAISKAASQMGEKFFNNNLLTILKQHSFKGTICDLGCGNASTLIFLCRKAKLSGLGFDFSASSIDIAKNTLRKNDKIVLMAKDITSIDEIYPEVDVLIQSFVMHDLPSNDCAKLLRSFLKCFPNVKMFFYIDAVSPENETLLQLPGFDYMHSLLGIKPRTLEETTSLLAESGFQIINRELVPGLTNCYTWTLSPSK